MGWGKCGARELRVSFLVSQRASSVSCAGHRLRGTRSVRLLVTEVQEAVPSRLGEAAPHPWSAAPGSPTGRTQGLISCQKNLLAIRDKRSQAAQGRLDLPHLGSMAWPSRTQLLTVNRCLWAQKGRTPLFRSVTLLSPRKHTWKLWEVTKSRLFF